MVDYLKDYPTLKDENHLYKNITIEELLILLQEGLNTAFIMIGGAWCKNCQAIINEVNEVAKKKGLDCIYNYDPKFINIFKEEENLIDCKSLEHKLNYYYIVEKCHFKSKELVTDTLIPRIHVPFFIALKNGDVVDFYSEELINDGYLHREGHKTNMEKKFKKNIEKLITKMDLDRRF